MTNKALIQLKNFISRISSIFPADYATLICSNLDQKEPLMFRPNGIKAQKEDIIKLDSAEIRLLHKPYQVYQYLGEDRQVFSQSPYVQEGFGYIQNLSSVAAYMALAPTSTDWVLDLAAAPGGKTLGLAQLMNNVGKIVAIERAPKRYQRLLSVLKVYGVDNVTSYQADGRTFGKGHFETFDKIMLDAPCSSESRIKSFDAKSYHYWSEKKIKDMQRMQKSLLYSAVLALKPGGKLLYATCAYAPEENEMMVDYALKKFNGYLAVEPLQLPQIEFIAGFQKILGKALSPEVTNARRIIPNGVQRGFFMAMIRKTKSLE